MELQNELAPAPGGQAEQATGQGYCIEIYVNPNGQVSVGVEQKPEAPEQEQGAEGRTPVGGIKEALQLVMEIYQNDGQQTDTATGEEELQAGFMGGQPIQEQV